MSPAAETEKDYVIAFSGIEVNIDRGTVARDGRRVVLTGPEYNLLYCFVTNADRNLSREWLLQSVWGYLSDPNTRTVDAHVMRLRRKLESDPERPRHFVTLHGVGYRFHP